MPKTNLNNRKIILFLSLVLGFCVYASAQTQPVVFRTPLKPAYLEPWVNIADATIATPEDAGTLCWNMAKMADSNAPAPTACLIHVLRWSEPDATTKKQSVVAQHWYAYEYRKKQGWSLEDLTQNKRLFGVDTLYFFYVHINRAGSEARSTEHPHEEAFEYQPQYTFNIAKKTPINIQHLLQLGQALTGATTEVSAPSDFRAYRAFAERPVSPDCEYGGNRIQLVYKPSDIRIISEVHPGPANTPANPIKLGGDITFDNEGTYVADFSLGIPIRHISEVTLQSVSGTVVPVNVDSTNVFMLADAYLPPADLKSNRWSLWPHAIAGLAFAKQPAHKILVGGAWGPHFSELYMAALWVKQPSVDGKSCTVPSGATATTFKYCVQFSIGLNVPITGFIDKLSAPK